MSDPPADGQATTDDRRLRTLERLLEIDAVDLSDALAEACRLLDGVAATPSAGSGRTRGRPRPASVAGTG